MIVTILAGLLSGIVSGMGIGGGTILIPVLTFFLSANQHVAQCTNLYYFIPTAVVALVVHIKNKNVVGKAALIIAAFGILGAVGGSFLAVHMQTALLRKIFAGFLFLMGLSQLFQKPKNKEKPKNSK